MGFPRVFRPGVCRRHQCREKILLEWHTDVDPPFLLEPSYPFKIPESPVHYKGGVVPEIEILHQFPPENHVMDVYGSEPHARYQSLAIAQLVYPDRLVPVFPYLPVPHAARPMILVHRMTGYVQFHAVHYVGLGLTGGFLRGRLPPPFC